MNKSLIVALPFAALAVTLLLLAILTVQNQHSVQTAIRSAPKTLDFKPIIHQEIQEKMKTAPKETITILVAANNTKAVKEKNIGTLMKETPRVLKIELEAQQVDELIKGTQTITVEPVMKYYLQLTQSLPLVSAPQAWSNGYDGAGVRIAIIDTGIDLTHEMFPSPKIVAQRDFTNSGSVQDMGSHGTHVAGIAAGSGPTYKGVAPGASLIVAKVFKAASDGKAYADNQDIAAAIEWAVIERADIISMSLGGSSYSAILEDAIARAKQQGVIVVIAAGNCGNGCPSFSCGTYRGITYPGASENAITVGSTTKSDYLSCFSSEGPIQGRIKPDVAAPGSSIVSSIPQNRYDSMDGTSMSTPHVAGAIAILKQKNPSVTFDQVQKILELTSIDLGQPGKDSQFGWGRLDISQFTKIDPNNLVSYRIQVEESFINGTAQQISFELDRPNVLVEIVANITNPNGIVMPLQFQKINSSLHQAGFMQTGLVGTYTIDGTMAIGSFFTKFQKQFSTYQWTMNESIITSVMMPDQMNFTDNLSIALVLKSSTSQTGYLEMQMLEENELKGIFNSDSFTLTANVPSTISMHKALGLPPSKYTVNLIAYHTTGSSTAKANITLLDNIAPIIASPPPSLEIMENMPADLAIAINDQTPLYGTMNIKKPSGELQTIDLFYQKDTFDRVRGISISTNEIGSYEYNAHICDQANNCIDSPTYRFTTLDCNKPSILIIKSKEDSSLPPYLSNYCVGELFRKGVALLPPATYLRQFDAVVWNADTDKENIAASDIDTLYEFISQNGSLVIEGNDVALKNQGSQKAESVLLAKLMQSMYTYSTNESAPQEQVNIVRKHPLVRGLGSAISINNSLDPSPDTLSPLLGATVLAKFVDNDAAMIAYEDNNRKFGFLSFSLRAIPESQRQMLVTNIAAWLTEKAATDEMITGHSFDKYPTQNTEFNLVLETTRGASENTVELSVNNNAPMVVSISQDGTAAVPLNLAMGTYNFTAIVNPSMEIPEKNYLNNYYTTEIRVAGLLADVVVQLQEHSFADGALSVGIEASNIGGTAVNEIPLHIQLDGETLSSESISLLPGQIKTIKRIIQTEKENIALTLIADPNNTTNENNKDNNRVEQYLSKCTKEKILIVDDNAAMSAHTNSPSSKQTFHSLLKANGYCTSLWSKSANGEPKSANLSNADLVVWSSGNYWRGILTANDLEELSRIEKPILFEGADLVLERHNSTFFQDIGKIALDSDVYWKEDTILTPLEHTITAKISSLQYNATKSPYPDSFYTFEAIPILQYSNNQTAMAIFENQTHRYAFIGFAIDALNADQKERLVYNTVAYLLNKTENTPPIIEPLNNISVLYGELITLFINATDADGDTLLYTTNSSRLQQVNNTNIFLWQTAITDTGTHAILINVSDQKVSRTATLFVTVNAIPYCGNKSVEANCICKNNEARIEFMPPCPGLCTQIMNFRCDKAPIITSLGAKDALAGRNITVIMNASDPEGEQLYYGSNDQRFFDNKSCNSQQECTEGYVCLGDPSCTGCPKRCLKKSGEFHWQTNSAEVGNYTSTFSVQDLYQKISSSVSFSVHESGQNHPPTISPIKAIVTLEGESVVVKINASDLDGDILSYMINDSRFIPDSIEPNVFRWNVPNTIVGSCNRKHELSQPLFAPLESGFMQSGGNSIHNTSISADMQPQAMRSCTTNGYSTCDEADYPFCYPDIYHPQRACVNPLTRLRTDVSWNRNEAKGTCNGRTYFLNQYNAYYQIDGSNGYIYVPHNANPNCNENGCSGYTSSGIREGTYTLARAPTDYIPSFSLAGWDKQSLDNGYYSVWAWTNIVRYWTQPTAYVLFCCKDADCGAGNYCETSSGNPLQYNCRQDLCQGISCGNTCDGDTRKFSGSCSRTSGSCSYQQTQYCGGDGWYCNGDTKERRDYYCSPEACQYRVPESQNCNSNDGWVCDGQYKVYHDYYCGSADCKYSESLRSFCEFGCQNGACKQDPCATISCNNYCSDSTRYSSTGCISGSCNYDTQVCGFGCNQTTVTCNSDPCVGIVCPDYCEGTAQYTNGQCNAGSCNYLAQLNATECGYVPACTNVYEFAVVVSDSINFVQTRFQVQVKDKDFAPQIMPMENIQKMESELVEIKVNSTDPDGDELQLEINDSRFEVNNNTFTWQTSFSDAGTYSLRINVSDGRLYNETELIMSIMNLNRAPVLLELSPINLTETQTVSFTPFASDSDDDVITYTINDTRFTNSNNTFQWPTTYNDAGVYRLRVSASDGQLSDEKILLVRVNNLNRGPIFMQELNETISGNEEAIINVTMSAFDPDNDTLSYQVSNLPQGAQLEGNTLWWTPTSEQSGNYRFNVSVTDGLNSATQSISIRVNNIVKLPVIDTLSQIRARENELVVIPLRLKSNSTPVSLYYTKTSDEQGEPIAKRLPLDGWHVWDATLVPLGAYYIYAVIDQQHDAKIWRGDRVFIGDEAQSEILSKQQLTFYPTKDIWTTSVYSYAPGSSTPGGGLDNHELRVGGWGDRYYSLVEIDLSQAPNKPATSAVLYLYNAADEGSSVSMYLDRITQAWSWQERLWWSQKPSAVQWNQEVLPAPARNEWYAIPITELWNGWVNGTYPHYGIQLRPTSTDHRFNEFYSADNSDQSRRPRVIVEYPSENTQVETNQEIAFTESGNTIRAASANYNISWSDNTIKNYTTIVNDSRFRYEDSQLSFQTNYESAGDYSLKVTASAGELRVEKIISIHIENMNRAPILEKSLDLEVFEGQRATVVPTATDSDGDEIIFIMNDTRLSKEGNGFMWQPTFDDSGVYTFKLIASDGELQDEKTFTVTVRDVNRAPLLSQPPNMSIDETQTASILLTAADPDGDQITFTINDTRFSRIDNGFEWVTNYTDAGEYDLTVSASDGQLHDEKRVRIIVRNRNRVPILTFIPDIQILETQTIILPLQASDPDGDPLIYSINDSQFTQSDNGFIWNTTYESAGVYTIIAAVSDGSATVSQPIRLKILNKNRAPILLKPKRIILDENQTVEIVALATDSDNDSLSYFIDMEKFTQSGNVFRWKTTYKDAGEYSATISVKDNDSAVQQKIDFSVTDVNLKPILEQPKNAQYRETDNVTITLLGKDLDGDDISYSLSDSRFEKSGANTFWWQTGYSSAGTYKITARVSDGQWTTEKQFSITVGNTNREPIIVVQPAITIGENQSAIIVVNATDPDGDALSYTINSTKFNRNNHTFSWKTGFDDAGTYSLMLLVSDGIITSRKTTTLVVTNTNQAPQIISRPPLVTRDGLAYTYQIAANDPDRHSLRYSLRSAPIGANFNATTGILKWTPTQNQNGTQTIEIVATDEEGLSTMQAFLINVRPKGTLPKIPPKLADKISHSPFTKLRIIITTTDHEKIKKKGIGKVVAQTPWVVIVDISAHEIPQIIDGINAKYVEENAPMFFG